MAVCGWGACTKSMSKSLCVVSVPRLMRHAILYFSWNVGEIEQWTAGDGQDDTLRQFSRKKNSINTNFWSGFPADMPDPYAWMPWGQKVSPHHRGSRKAHFLVRTSTIFGADVHDPKVVEQLCTKKVCVDFWPLNLRHVATSCDILRHFLRHFMTIFVVLFSWHRPCLWWQNFPRRRHFWPKVGQGLPFLLL